MKANIILTIIFMAGALLVSFVQLNRISENKKKAGQILVKWYANGLAIFPVKLVAGIIILLYLAWLYVSNKATSSGLFYALSSLAIMVFITTLFFWRSFCALGSLGVVIRNEFRSLEEVSMIEVENKKFLDVLKVRLIKSDKNLDRAMALLLPRSKSDKVRQYLKLYFQQK